MKSDPHAPGKPASDAKDSSTVEERREPEPRVFADAEWDETRYRPLTLPLPPLSPEEGGAAARCDPRGPMRETHWLRHAEANDGRVVLLQLPSQLPFFAGAGGAAGRGGAGGDGQTRALDPLSDPDALVDAQSARLGQLGAGRLGKLLVFESGAVRLQIEGSEVLFDVQPGVPVAHRHEVAIMAPASKQAVLLGGAKQRLVATPHLESLLRCVGKGRVSKRSWNRPREARSSSPFRALQQRAPARLGEAAAPDFGGGDRVGAGWHGGEDGD